jgi:hypothetical protein
MLPDPVYRAGYAPAEDYDLWIRLCQTCRMHNLSESLVAYRKHGNNVSVADNTGLVATERKLLAENAQRLTGESVTDGDAVLLHRLFYRHGIEKLSVGDVDRLVELLSTFGNRFPGEWKQLDRATFHRLLLERVLELRMLRSHRRGRALAATLMTPVCSPADRLRFAASEAAAALQRKAGRALRRWRPE